MSGDLKGIIVKDSTSSMVGSTRSFIRVLIRSSSTSVGGEKNSSWSGTNSSTTSGSGFGCGSLTLLPMAHQKYRSVHASTYARPFLVGREYGFYTWAS